MAGDEPVSRVARTANEPDEARRDPALAEEMQRRIDLLVCSRRSDLCCIEPRPNPKPWLSPTLVLQARIPALCDRSEDERRGLAEAARVEEFERKMVRTEEWAGQFDAQASERILLIFVL